ncbi:MAG: hypothetical protein J0G96_00690 [Flavobacteriia bacterium]|nr:hypothetical protein [Flavobacteriia bacterium]OJX36155.1 MAG: hypothetical protein BGO87_06730 [Flavobacteriia bacterium 40-80]
MNPFKKINTYLIENHPDLWHVRLPFLLMTGLLLHIFSFLYGFEYIDETRLVNDYISGSIADSWYILFEIILLLVVIVTWALQFFKNSVLKHYYVAGDFYAIKMYLLLVGLFLWNISSFLSFYYGVHLKRDALMSKYEVNEIFKEKAFLDPLLLLSREEYNLSNNKYLTQNEIEYKVLYSSEDAPQISYCTEEDYISRNYEQETYFSCYTDVSDIDSSLFSKLDDDNAVFFRLKYLNRDERCERKVIDKYVVLNDFHLYDIKNHSNYTDELDGLLKKEDYKVLAERLKNFKTRLNKLEKFTNFDPWVNLCYIVKKKGIDFEDIYRDYDPNKRFIPINNIDEVTDDLNIQAIETYGGDHYYFRNYELSILESNLNEDFEFYYMFIGALIGSIVFSYFMIQFQYVDFINYAISIPISGVLSIVGSLFMLIFTFVMKEYSVIFYLFSMTTAILLILLLSAKLNVRLKEILMILLSSFIPAAVLISYALIGIKIYTQEVTYGGCGATETYSQFFTPPFYEWHFITLGLFSIFAFLYLVKKLKSKPE